MKNQKDHIARTIAERVRDGQYAEGTALPSQAQLSSEFGMSQGTISSAKWLLTGAGVVVHGGRKGTQVPAGAAENAARLLRNWAGSAVPAG